MADRRPGGITATAALLALLGVGGLAAGGVTGFDHPIHSGIAFAYAGLSLTTAVLLWRMSPRASACLLAWSGSVVAHLAAYQFGPALGPWALFLAVAVVYAAGLVLLNRFVRAKLRSAA